MRDALVGAKKHRVLGLLVAIYWFDLGVAGFFGALAAGFSLYAAMLV